jgi:hypothetical protein
MRPDRIEGTVLSGVVAGGTANDGAGFIAGGGIVGTLVSAG